MESLQGKVALVTGGGRGIGRELALALAHVGCDVAVLARTATEIEPVAAQVRASGRRGVAQVCDISSGESVLSAHAAVTRQLGSINILINNAATVQPIGPTVAIDPERWMYAINTNLAGPFRWIHSCLPTMLEDGWGRIICISSSSGIGTGMPRGNAYSVAKAGLEMLVHNLAHELEGSGVMVNSVHPGWVDTDMQTYVRDLPTHQVGETFSRYLHEIHTNSTLLSPDQPAHLVVNLLQDELTGQTISIYDERGQELLRA